MVGKILTCCVGSKSFIPHVPTGYSKVLIANDHTKPMSHPQLSSSTLMTDGNELQPNDRNITFHNLWSGSLVHSTINDVKVDKKGTVWQSRVVKGSDCLDLNGCIKNEYFLWRDDVWNSSHSLTFDHKDEPLFCLISNCHNKDDYKRLSLYDARKRFYLNDYCRLVRRTKDYKDVLKSIIDGNNICIYDYDLPTDKTKGKTSELCRGMYMKVNWTSVFKCINDVKNVKISSGLALSFCLLSDLKDINILIEDDKEEINVDDEVVKKLQPLLPLKSFDKLCIYDITNKGPDYLLRGHRLKDQRDKKFNKSYISYISYMDKHKKSNRISIDKPDMNKIKADVELKRPHIKKKDIDVKTDLKSKWSMMNDNHIKRLALAYDISFVIYDKQLVIDRIIQKISL